MLRSARARSPAAGGHRRVATALFPLLAGALIFGDPVAGALAAALPLAGLGSRPFTPAAATAAPEDEKAIERAVLAAVNELRSERGERPLRASERLAELARRHSRAMAEGRVPFSHRGFEGRAAALREHRPGATVAENVAFSEGYDDPAATAVESWRGSRRHRKTMLGDWQHTGIGVARSRDGRVFVTQLFLTAPDRRE